MAASVQPAVVKSAGRVLRILEFFDAVRAPANVGALAALGAPAPDLVGRG